MFGVPIHPMTVHFPIALMIVALVYDVRAYTSEQSQLHERGYGLTLWAAAGAALAVITGLQAMGGRGFDNPRAVIHTASGLTAGLSIIALAVARYSASARQLEPRAYYPAMWLVLELFAGAVVVAAMITGHRMSL
jgi:uncharacterized membrane protein